MNGTSHKKDELENWLSFPEIYQLPHVQYFISFEEVESLNQRADLRSIHLNMNAVQ